MTGCRAHCHAGFYTPSSGARGMGKELSPEHLPCAPPPPPPCSPKGTNCYMGLRVPRARVFMSKAKACGPV